MTSVPAQGGGAPPRDAPTERVVPRDKAGSRLDRFLADALPASRSEVKRWIEADRVTVDGAPRDASAKVREAERVLVLPGPAPATRAIADERVAFDVLYVDEDVVVVNKPAGLVVHPARGHQGGTLVNGLLARGLFRREAFVDSAVEAHDRPGIVHRLDRGTSGLLVVARHPAAREALKAQFQAHTIERAYEAIVVGRALDRTWSTLYGRDPRNRLRFTTHVDRGRRAVTHVRTLAGLDGATHVECRLETGRTHQIRVHLAEGGTPVLGDPLYGKAPRDPRVRDVGARLGHQALHARLLGLKHPRTGGWVRFEAVAPGDFVAAREALQAMGPGRR